MRAEPWIDTHTPTLSAMDPRGLAIRNIAYCRHPLNPSIEARISSNGFDARRSLQDDAVLARQRRGWFPAGRDQPDLQTGGFPRGHQRRSTLLHRRPERPQVLAANAPRS